MKNGENGLSEDILSNDKKISNKSLHWIFTPLHSIKISEFKRSAYANKLRVNRDLTYAQPSPLADGEIQNV